jgi:hypothetical protein
MKTSAQRLPEKRKAPPKRGPENARTISRLASDPLL